MENEKAEGLYFLSSTSKKKKRKDIKINH